ncbi:OmpA family protein [Thiovibrio sp. JS02]
MGKWKILLCLLCIGLLAACGTKHADLPFDGGDLSAKLGQGYVQKVDTAFFVLDASSSMFDDHEGVQKFSAAKNLLLRMNAAIAGLKLDAGLQVFGPRGSELIYGVKPYDSSEFAAAAAAVGLGGLTPMSRALNDSVEALRDSKGRIAVIVLSDGLSTSATDPVQAAAELKKAYGERICIHTVLIGNDPKGKATMEAIAQAGGCGFATTASSLASGAELAGFLEKVFLEKAPLAAMKPAPVAKPVPTERIILRGINFDFDQAVIKPEFMPVLDVAVGILKGRPDLKVVAEGHTCDLGSDAYNQRLSERRARAVYDYLVRNGVNAASLSTVGHGETQPMADNKAPGGRELNRRVEFKVVQ